MLQVEVLCGCGGVRVQSPATVDTFTHISTQTRTPTKKITVLGLQIGAIDRKLHKNAYKLLYKNRPPCRYQGSSTVAGNLLDYVRSQIEVYQTHLVLGCTVCRPTYSPRHWSEAIVRRGVCGGGMLGCVGCVFGVCWGVWGCLCRRHAVNY